MRNKRRAVFAASVVIGAALLFFAIGNADAQSSSSPITLLWNAPAGCSDSAAILKQVAGLRGGATASAEQMSAVANVSLDASGVWNLRITTNFADGTHGERQIQAESCKAAADATASILALALTTRAQVLTTPTAELDASSPLPTEVDAAARRPAPPPAAIVTPQPGIPEPSEPIEPPKPPPSIHAYVGANFGGTTGDLPSLGLGGGGDLGISYRRFRFEAFANYWAFARARFPSPGGADFQMFSAGARTCVWWLSTPDLHWFGDSLSLGPCAAFELGSMSGESFDVTSPSSGSALMMEGFVGALGTLSLDKNRRFALRALLEIGATFERPQFVLDGVGFVHQPALVVGRGTFGAELRF